MRLTRLHLFSLSLALLLPQLLATQRLSPTPPLYDAKAGLIKLDVVVTDQAGDPISGIAANDITLLDDGKPVKILTFHVQNRISTSLEDSVTIILLVDTLNLPERIASYERREVERFLQQNGGHLAQPVSLFELSSMGILSVGQPTTDGSALAAEFAHNNNLRWIRRVPGELRGESLDTLLSEPPGLSALKALGDIATTERQLPGRKLLIWIGPGWAVGSGAYIDSMGPKQNTFDTIEWFSTLLREARICLYSFSVGETNPDGRSLNYLSLLSGVKSVKQATFMHLNRKVLAVQTGGRVLEPSADLIGSPVPGLTDFRPNTNLVVQIDRCLQEAETFYTLSFDPSDAGHPDEYHDLKVQVSKPGVRARSTTGYYDQPYYSDHGSPTVRPVTVEQLEQLLSTPHNRSDAELARQLAELILTERLSTLKLLSLSAAIRSEKARQALIVLADESAFMDPPANEIAADTPPDHESQQRIAALASEYLNKAVPNLPNIYATRTATHYQENPLFEKGDAKTTYQPLHVADTVKDTVFYRNGY
jgi:VWFA-related protein